MNEPETTSTETTIYLGVWTNFPSESVDFSRDTFLKLRNLPGKAPEIPYDGDETL